jgi:alkylhydroperoxidase family enzyme
LACAAKLGQSKESLFLLKAFNMVQAVLTALVSEGQPACTTVRWAGHLLERVRAATAAAEWTIKNGVYG